MGLELTRARLLEYLSREISDKRVLQAMARVPRELFVLPDCYHSAYEDIPLSIGFGQTISQPFIVALMTQALKLRGDEKVLEVGTGSGYQTAILAELARCVVSVERVPQLAESAKTVLERLGYTNIQIHLAGKTLGWPSEAPYNAILVTAGSPRVPDGLLKQLAFGGRLVVPVGSRWEQELYRITKRKSGNSVDRLGGCRFVPLIGEEAWEE
ncbi:MAG: protein-L-isoaspartate(D-aspartate) O-methyltransferase [Chloroflexi bacterium]|nr:protein-L-isoaspartate(D-aspartate) O-methyltransferase [Chloroflexota bacterium]MBM3182580.1 protein-L-isoaspartate(D-aspartate) O-methyltransferase [Chloroflexota bacterium]MBM4454000.1 protein-L-isoaspartate(D-aspartate) O-methyltransferase [Chloroflexota bacterium]